MKHLTYRIALIFAIMALSCANAFAQQVKGTVKDSAGEPVIGAAVVVEGTTTGTTVDLDGNFVFNTAVPSDAVLVVTAIGYKEVKVPVGGGHSKCHPSGGCRDAGRSRDDRLWRSEEGRGISRDFYSGR